MSQHTDTDRQGAPQPSPARRRAVVVDEADVVDFDWQTPCRFTTAERARLEQFAQQASTRLAEGLAELMGPGIALEPVGVTHHYGAPLRAGLAEETTQRIPLRRPKGEPCGLISLSQDLAVGWVNRLLGVPMSAEVEQRRLSPLETTLLLDIVASLAKALSAAVEAAGGLSFEHVETVETQRIPLPEAPSAEFCAVTFQVVGAEERSGRVVLILESRMVEPIAIRGGGKDEARPPDAVRRDLRAHLERAPIICVARLGMATITVRDLVSLESGDVLILNRQVTDPIDITVSEKPVLVGLPVQTGDRYAVKVLQRRSNARLDMDPGDTSAVRPNGGLA